MRKPRMRLLLVAALAMLCSHAGAKRPVKPDPRVEDELFTGMTRLFQALLGADGADLYRVETGPRDLARQRAAARREGIPLTPQEFQRPSPPPELDAAPIYVQLTQLLKEKPLDPNLEEAASRLGSRYPYGAEDVAAARKLVSERQDVVALVHQATDRPYCVFRRDWSLGSRLTFPEYSPARAAARLLRTESYLLALDGHCQEAVATQTRGFRIAAQMAPDGLLIAYLVGIACDAITLAGMEDLLYRAGPDAEVAEQVRSAIETYRPSFSLRRALEGEVVLEGAVMNELRREGIRSLHWFAQRDPAEDARSQKRLAAVEQSPQMRRFWRLLTDAGEADMLQRMRQAIAISERPYPVQKRLARQWSDAANARSRGMVDLFRLVLLPVIGLDSTKEMRLRANERVLMAGASVLAYRDRRGQWPDRLEQAASWPTSDPWTGRPLRYRREGDGFVVYSVGENGRYGGGKPGVPRDRLQAVFRYPAPPPQAPQPLPVLPPFPALPPAEPPASTRK